MQYKLTKSGYERHSIKNGKRIFEHRKVWEDFYGEIPEGMQIHHKDFDKTNNDISNLQLVTPLEHRRLHEGCLFINGEWYKPCKQCGEYKLCDKNNWYYARGTINGKLCKQCYIKKVVNERRVRVANGWKRKDYRKKTKGLQPIK